MTLKVASWNIEGRLSNLAVNHRGTPAKIIRTIAELQADVLVLLEAFSDEKFPASVQRMLHQLGYQLVSVPYEEGGAPRSYSAVHRPSLLLLSKLPLVDHVKIRLGDLRNALVVRVRDPSSGQIIRLIGVHLDDRAEALRLKQVPDLIGLVRSVHEPTIVLGDFNAMHRRSAPARLLQNSIIKLLIRHLTPGLGRRVVEMAEGRTLRELQAATGFRDADPLLRPTTTPKMRGHEWLPSIRLIQIDHMLVSPEVKVSHFHVSADGGSDHRAISAMIALDKS